MKPKVYVYRNCDTCRKAIKFLTEEGVEFQEMPIREQPPTKAEIDHLVAAALRYGVDIQLPPHGH